MKAISASIVILAAAVLIAAAAATTDLDTKPFVFVVGCGLGLVGLAGWFAALRGNN